MISVGKLRKLCSGSSYLEEIVSLTSRGHKILAEAIPPKRKCYCNLKMSEAHPRSGKYKNFIRTLEKIDFVTEVRDVEAKQAKYSKVKIRDKELLITYVDGHNNRGYRISVKTTAENEMQLLYAANFIESLLPRSI